jgi:hypothetical protein
VVRMLASATEEDSGAPKRQDLRDRDPDPADLEAEPA